MTTTSCERRRRASRRRSVGPVVGVFALLLGAGCAPPPAAPAAAVLREGAPPWDAPRDAVSYIQLAGLEELRSGYIPVRQLTAQLDVTVDDVAVEVPAFVGIDRVRSIEAPLHTHEAGGRVWVEHPSELPDVTLGDFFDLWGVRLDDGCVGNACSDLEVRVDGRPVTPDTDPRDVRWASGMRIEVDARTD